MVATSPASFRTRCSSGYARSWARSRPTGRSVVDVHAKLDELTALIENARAMPMSASCVVNRAEVLSQLDELRAMLPGALADAQRVIEDRSAVVATGQEEADRIIEAAQAERARMLARTDVLREASREAQRLVDSARSDADRMRLEIDDYVD